NFSRRTCRMASSTRRSATPRATRWDSTIRWRACSRSSIGILRDSQSSVRNYVPCPPREEQCHGAGGPERTRRTTRSSTRNGAPGTTDQKPRWEGPEETRPRGYLPAKDDPERDRDAAGENLRAPDRNDLGDAMKKRGDDDGKRSG